MKQILLQLDSVATQRFITADLDDTHLLVQNTSIEYITELLNAELEKNNYVVPE